MRARFFFVAGAASAIGVAAACVGDDPSVPPALPDASGDSAPPTDSAPADTGSDAGRTVVATGQKFPLTLAVLGPTIYWVDTGGTAGGCTDTPDGTIMSANIDGTGTPVTIATGLKCPSGLAVTADKVYWSERGTPTGIGDAAFGDGAIKRADHNGASPETLVSNVQFPLAIRVHGDQLYYFTGPGNAADDLWRISITTVGAPVHVASVARSASGLFVDDAFIYWSEDNSGNVWRLPESLDAGVDANAAKTRIGVNQTVPTNPIPSADDASVFWFNHGGGGALVRHDIASSSETIIAQNIAPGGSGRQIAIDDKYLYYTTTGAPAGRVPLNGGADTPVEKIAPDLVESVGLFVTDDSIYLSAGGATGSIYRILK